jgi:hypothetical protein
MQWNVQTLAFTGKKKSILQACGLNITTEEEGKEGSYMSS